MESDTPLDELMELGRQTLRTLNRNRWLDYLPETPSN